MDYLWTPWRYAYITTAAKHDGKPEGCIFCELPKLPDPDAKIIYRGEHCYIILNSFPYTSGHVMAVPFAHMDELRKLPDAAAQEMMSLSQKMEGVLRVAGHIHMHILPRWVGDTNFMTVTGETRVLPESLDETFRRLTAALKS
jgi:ATP adenylyltransferase